MHRLELKIPPPIVGLVVAIIMWAGTSALPALTTHLPRHFILAAAILAALGVFFSAAGMLAFRRARTTVNPFKPNTASALVTSGVYGKTRNPMYLGLLLALTGWALYLASLPAALGPILFFLYITRFQILPEERVLTSLFGSTYTEYCQQVRRWA